MMIALFFLRMCFTIIIAYMRNGSSLVWFLSNQVTYTLFPAAPIWASCDCGLVELQVHLIAKCLSIICCICKILGDSRFDLLCWKAIRWSDNCTIASSFILSRLLKDWFNYSALFCMLITFERRSITLHQWDSRLPYLVYV